jgi:hypothetical protein
MHMRAHSLTPLVAGLAVSAALAQPPAEARPSCVPRDPYDPAALAEFAQERDRAGDAATARIMLARAARIAGGAAIARDGSAIAIVPVAAPQAGARQDTPPQAPPPLWPAKQEP